MRPSFAYRTNLIPVRENSRNPPGAFAPTRHRVTRSFAVARLLAVAAALCAGPLVTRAAERKPNVIVILTDDQGSVDMNLYGATDLATPNMDALARRGVRFTQFYAGACVCSPSRAALLTGRNPYFAGVPGNVGQKNGLPPEQNTIAEVFKAAGYATAHIGKWHLGHSPDMIPNAQGFDYSFGFMNGCIDNYSHFFYWAGPNRHDLYRNGVEIFESGHFLGDLMVNEARGFMARNKDRPFFIYYAINMPHYPYQGDEKWLKHYADTPAPRNLYAAFLSTCDERIGQLLQAVDELGLTRDTIVAFQSDHGHSVEERAYFGGGSSGPYRGHKFLLLEGGIRIPAIVSWPGHIPEGEVRTQMVTSCDWMPTLCALAGIPGPANAIDGLDVSSIIASAEAPTPHRVFHWESCGQWAVRQGPWKLLHPGKNQPPELYNVENDPGEADNLAAQNPDKAAELQRLHDAWVKSGRSHMR